MLTLLVLGVFFLAGKYFLDTRPEVKRRPPTANIPVVEVMTVSPQDYQIMLATRGIVSPRTSSNLIPQVSGRIVHIADNFRQGSFFSVGDELLRIETIDYELALTIAEAEQASARLALQEEQAQAEQSKLDWQQLALSGQASDLVLRKPQMENAYANLAAATARVEQVRLALSRTHLLAPFAGRIIDKQVDVGQYVTPGTVLARLYAIDYVEVRLPLSEHQLGFVELPEAYAGESVMTTETTVNLQATFGGQPYSWQGRIVRTESAIDDLSRQLFMIVQVDDPWKRHDSGRPPLKPGQFVRAQISGRQLSGVFLLPRDTVNGNDEVMLLDADNHLRKRSVEVVWRDQQYAVINNGLEPGERLITTAMPYAVDGVEVQVKSDRDK